MRYKNYGTIALYYTGGASVNHPTTAADIAAGKKYKFYYAAYGIQPGDKIATDYFKLELADADRLAGNTEATLSLPFVVIPKATLKVPYPILRKRAAQIAPVPCINAIDLGCSQVYSQVDASGINGNEINQNSSCLGSGAKQGEWFQFTALSNGVLNFTLTPNILTDDYDWAVYDVTGVGCGGIAANPNLEIGCNYDGTPGTTGANNVIAVQNGPAINVISGRQYRIFISYFNDALTAGHGFTYDSRASSPGIFPAGSNFNVTASNNTVCGGANVTLSTNGSPAGMQFTWQGNGLSATTGATVTATPVTTTTYTVTGEVPGGLCPAIDRTITVTVNPLPVLSITGADFSCNTTNQLCATVTPVETSGTYTWSSTVNNSFTPSSSACGQVLTCNAPAWNAGTQYQGDAGLGNGNGAIVLFNGRRYRALWWTQGKRPDLFTWHCGTCDAGANMWLDLGPCVTTSTGSSIDITKSATYTVNYVDANGCSAIANKTSVFSSCCNSCNKQGNVYFADPVFKQALLNMDVNRHPKIDINNDGEISYTEACAVRNIFVVGKNITSVQGLEAFENIFEIQCQNNSIKTMDLRCNKKLQNVRCMGNQIEQLLVDNTDGLLENLNCTENNLKELDMSNCKKLVSLYCNNNQLINLKISDCILLKTLECGNNKLTSFDLQNKVDLNLLLCHTNNLTSLDLSCFPKLGVIISHNNNINGNILLTNNVYSAALINSPGNFTKDVNVSWAIGTCPTVIRLATTEQISEAFDVRIAPNPTEGVSTITISGAQSETLKISIVNINGEIIYNNDNAPANESFVLNQQHLSSGVYIVHIQDNENVITQKLFIAK